MCLGLILSGLSIVLWGCMLEEEAAPEDSIELCLPQWPPAAPADTTAPTPPYPALSRWHIRVTGAEAQYSFYTTASAVPLSTKKNRPLCVTAQPVTFLENGRECAYFKPAGYMYPFTQKISWEQGYLASLMQKLFCQGQEECLSPVELEYLISTFNWKKAQETIEKKLAVCTESSETSTSSQLFYDPWLIPETPILEGITARAFKASFLNNTGCAALPLSALPAPAYFSSFIPENFSLSQKNQFTVLKNSPIIIGDGTKYGYFVTYKTAKNISLEFIYLPIYIEDI